jgi:hypothetical protein
MTVTAWLAYAPITLLVLVFAIVVRWLLTLQRRLADHAERIAHLEGKEDHEH